MWSYWSNSLGSGSCGWSTAASGGKLVLLAPLGISVLLCGSFGILLRTHLLRALWQVKSPASVCHLLVCTPKCSNGQKFCLCCIWIYCFVLLFASWRVSKPGSLQGKWLQNIIRDILHFWGSFPLSGGMFWRVCSKGRELSLFHLLLSATPFNIPFHQKLRKFGWRKFCCDNLNPSRNFIELPIYDRLIDLERIRVCF